MLKNKAFLFFIIFFSVVFSNCNKKDIITNLPSINTDNNKIVGASSNDLLSTAKFSSLKIEIQYMPGYQADASAVNNTVDFLKSLMNKSSGITVTQQQLTASGKSSLSLNDIATVEQQNRTAFNNGSQMDVYILIADAAYIIPFFLVMIK